MGRYTRRPIGLLHVVFALACLVQFVAGAAEPSSLSFEEAAYNKLFDTDKSKAIDAGELGDGLRSLYFSIDHEVAAELVTKHQLNDVKTSQKGFTAFLADEELRLADTSETCSGRLGVEGCPRAEVDLRWRGRK